MSFDTFERSNYDGQPVALYEFLLGSNSWRYSSSEDDVTVGGRVFKGTSISDSGIMQSGDVTGDDFTVTLPANLEVAALFLGTPPSQTVNLLVRHWHRDDPDAPIVWYGDVRSTKRVSTITIEMICKLNTATMNRPGLRLSWGRGCPFALYDQNCKVNPAAFGIAVQVTGLTGSTVYVSGAIAEGYLNGGYIEWTFLPGVKERRAIEGNSGGSIYLLGTTDGLAVDTWVTVYPGCTLTSSTCKDKFNNLSNYGGFAQLPTKSPFDGDPVF